MFMQHQGALQGLGGLYAGPYPHLSFSMRHASDSGSNMWVVGCGNRALLSPMNADTTVTVG